MNRELYIDIIKDYALYIEGLLYATPPISIYTSQFRSLSRTKWVAEEIIKEIENNPSVSPITITEIFAERMNSYSIENDVSSMCFSEAYDANMDILDRLLSLTHNGKVI